MKKIYSILSLSLILMTVSVFGQSRIYTPNLTAPENMAVDQAPNATLDWEAVTGGAIVIEYELQLAGNPDFSDAITFEKTDLTATTMTNLVFGGMYYWRVRAYDNDLVSDWSEGWSFTVAWSITMDEPDDGEEVYVNPVISWIPLTGVDGYELQIDTVYAWTNEESGVTNDILATAIVSVDDMWAVGVDGMVLHGDGNTWSTVDIGVTENLTSVSFIDASNGYVVGDGGTVVNFNGTDWTTVDVGTTQNLTGVSFLDADNGVVVGESGTIVVYAAGTWTEAVSGDDNNLTGVTMVSPSNIWACGVSKVVVNYNGTEWFVNEVGTKDHFAIAMVDENNGWVVSAGGKIDRWNGTQWLEESSPAKKDLYSVSFVGMSGYAVGKAGTMLIFNGSWSTVSSGSTEDLMGVTVTNDNGLVVGNGGVMLRKANAGFDSPYLLTYDIPADTASWDIHNLLFGNTFYYRIRTFHGDDISQWSGVKSMITQASPILTSPETGTENDLYIKFEWEPYEGITNYIFEVDTDENFGMPRSFTPDEDTLMVNDFVFGDVYYWRVAAQHAEDISEWSEVWTFNTVNTIILESPNNDAAEVKVCPLFDWVAVAGTSEYELWVDTDNTFSDPNIKDTEDASYQCESTMDYNTVYYWKVRGKSGALVSEWSDTWSFKTIQGIGIEEELSSESMIVFPNPGNGEFNLNFVSTTTNNYQVRVIDISGKLVYETVISSQAGNNSIPISISNINSGSYSLIISNDDQAISKRLIIK